MGLAGVRDLLQRGLAGCFANLGLKLVALVIAVIIYALVHRTRDEPEAPEPAAACPPER